MNQNSISLSIRNSIGRKLSVWLVTVLSTMIQLPEAIGSEIPIADPLAVVGLRGNRGGWYLCTARLQELSSKRGPVLDLRHFSLEKDPEFLMYLAAVIYVESRFEPHAHSGAEAYGLMQLTEVAAIQAAETCHLPIPKWMGALYDPRLNVRYGSCYLRKLLVEMDGDLDKALIAYNGGYRQLARFERGEPMVPETANYVLQVRHALNICK